MKNIELKIKVNNFKEIEKSLRALGAKYQGVLKQKDTYFKAVKGRLKIREINNKNFELIFYERPDLAMNKLSNFFVLPIDRARAMELKNILSLSLGVKVVVDKSRKLWLYKNTRIHLDDVNKLGKFLELETFLEKISKPAGEKEYFEIYERLKLRNFKKINNSYSDLLLK